MRSAGDRASRGRLALRVLANIGDARAALAGIPNDQPEPITPYVLDGICSGQFQARTIMDEGVPVGLLVYALEGREFVVIAAKAKSAVPLRHSLDALCTDLARSVGAKTIRFHTIRPGLVTEALSNGYHVAEIIMRKTL